MPSNVAPDQSFPTETSMENAMKQEHPTKNPRTRNGLLLMIMMDKSTVQKGVKACLPLVLMVVSVSEPL